MRLCAFSFLNIPHVYCVLFTKYNPLFSCANICYNQALQAMVNYGNGNIKNPQATKASIVQDFAKTIGASTSIVLGIQMLFSKRLKGLKGSKLILGNTLLNMFAVGTANAMNVVIMRRKEFQEGIPVKNKSGVIQRKLSTTAGETAVLETCLSRMFMPLPGLLLPVTTIMLLRNLRIHSKTSPLPFAFQLMFAFCSFSLITLPLSTGLFQPF